MERLCFKQTAVAQRSVQDSALKKQLHTIMQLCYESFHSV